jgi:hypothetical protein
MWKFIFCSSHLVVVPPDAGGSTMNRRVRLGFPLSEAEFCLRQMDAAASAQRREQEEEEKREWKSTKNEENSPAKNFHNC